jgi:hypothetical protein
MGVRRSKINTDDELAPGARAKLKSCEVRALSHGVMAPPGRCPRAEKSMSEIRKLARREQMISAARENLQD